MLIRNATDADLAAITTLIEATPGAEVNTVKPARFAEYLGLNSYRPEWMWVAEDVDRLVGAVVCWGQPQHDQPMSIDALCADPAVADPAAMWAELLRAAPATLDYHLFLSGSWRDDAATVAALQPRLAAARAAGLTETLERYRYEWTRAMPVPPRSTRLELRPEPDDAAWVRMFADVADGSLDAATAAEVRELGLTGYAEAEVESYRAFVGDRAWWRFAYDADGELVGFAMPSANQSGPVVGFLGVRPAHRGRGYGDDLLAEIVADHADRGAARIVADTDSTNTPMAAAFDRGGWHRFGIRLVLSHPV
jgi:ribosomal protein S18 acetylase RimI-like enzyme